MSELSFIDKYGKSKPDKRADIILDHFQDFPSIIEVQMKTLVLKIRNEREYLQKSQKDNLGAVILTGTKSDPTAKQAIEQVYVEELVYKGEDISELMHGMENKEKMMFYRQFHILRKMQEEYAILEGQILLMNSNEKRFFELYSESGHDFQYIAEQEGIRYDSARRRVWEIRKKIKSKAVNNMSEII